MSIVLDHITVRRTLTPSGQFRPKLLAATSAAGTTVAHEKGGNVVIYTQSPQGDRIAIGLSPALVEQIKNF